MSIDKHMQVEEFINSLKAQISEYTIAKNIIENGQSERFYNAEYEAFYNDEEGFLSLEIEYNIEWDYHCTYYEISGPEYTLIHFEMSISKIKATYYGENPISDAEEITIPIEALKISETEIINQAKDILG